MRIQSINEPSKWFAWHPVLAEETTPQGVVYYWVWMEFVTRKRSRVSGISVWSYYVR